MVSVVKTLEFNDAIFKKLCENAKLDSNEFLNSEENLDVCNICDSPYGDKECHTLKCGHKYHLECISKWYITCGDKKSALKAYNTCKPQTCPYCRKQGGYIPLKEGQKHIDAVHGNHVKKVLVKKKLVLYCQAVLASKNSTKCGNKAKVVVDGVPKFCGIHASWKNKSLEPVPTTSGISGAAASTMGLAPAICKAVKKNGGNCTNLAKYGHPNGPKTHCGVHKASSHQYYLNNLQNQPDSDAMPSLVPA